jgi:hypothetical protein
VDALQRTLLALLAPKHTSLTAHMQLRGQRVTVCGNQARCGQEHKNASRGEERDKERECRDEESEETEQREEREEREERARDGERGRHADGERGRQAELNRMHGITQRLLLDAPQSHILAECLSEASGLRRQAAAREQSDRELFEACRLAPVALSTLAVAVPQGVLLRKDTLSAMVERRCFKTQVSRLPSSLRSSALSYVVASSPPPPHHNSQNQASEPLHQACEHQTRRDTQPLSVALCLSPKRRRMQPLLSRRHMYPRPPMHPPLSLPAIRLGASFDRCLCLCAHSRHSSL